MLIACNICLKIMNYESLDSKLERMHLGAYLHTGAAIDNTHYYHRIESSDLCGNYFVACEYSLDIEIYLK